MDDGKELDVSTPCTHGSTRAIRKVAVAVAAAAIVADDRPLGNDRSFATGGRGGKIQDMVLCMNV